LVTADGGTSSRASEWDWILEGDLELLGSLTFVRGASPEQIIEAFGMDPAAAQLLPAARASEAVRLPAWDETYEVVNPWIRAGRTGEWAFEIDEGSVGWTEYQTEVTQALSRGTDVAWFSWTPTIDYFHYFVDGVEVTAFEPLLAQHRSGSDPDRFLTEMVQAGLDPFPDTAGEPGPGETQNPRIGLLEMLTLALGIRLPREAALGPLLTVQRGRSA
jgi:Family of unknown function (DUF6461)